MAITIKVKDGGTTIARAYMPILDGDLISLIAHGCELEESIPGEINEIIFLQDGIPIDLGEKCIPCLSNMDCGEGYKCKQIRKGVSICVKI